MRHLTLLSQFVSYIDISKYATIRKINKDLLLVKDIVAVRRVEGAPFNAATTFARAPYRIEAPRETRTRPASRELIIKISMPTSICIAWLSKLEVSQVRVRTPSDDCQSSGLVDHVGVTNAG